MLLLLLMMMMMMMVHGTTYLQDFSIAMMKVADHGVRCHNIVAGIRADDHRGV
jgi:hypothetical protein